MGWGSIFDPVAYTLIDRNVTEEVKRAVLEVLIKELQESGWDEEDSSLEKFQNDPVIVELLVRAGTGRCLFDASTNTYGLITYLTPAKMWTLNCDECPPDQFQIRVSDATNTGHDFLVRAWAEHLCAAHGGDGVVDTSKFLSTLS
jgi:hypothetical protein